MAKKPYKLTIGTGAAAQNYPLYLEEQVYGDVADVLGLKLATAEDNFNGLGSVKDLVRAGLLTKVRATGKNASTNKTKSFSLWCAMAQVPNAVGKLPTKSISTTGGTFNITKAGRTLTTRYR
jgi:hypothetical protein